MRHLSIPVRVSVPVLGMVVFLAMLGRGQVKPQAGETPAAGAAKAAPQPGDIPLCNGRRSGSSAGQLAAQTKPHPHFVTLSWNAAVPASNSPRDLIKGYYLYRSLVSHTYKQGDRISALPVPGNQCVDTTVEPQRTYFYVVKAVTEGGTQSGSSIEIKAAVPAP
jgi:hypothetical protein